MWTIIRSDTYDAWLTDLAKSDRRAYVALLRSLALLAAVGPSLGRPHVDTVKGSRHAGMKELRTQVGGRPLRSLFAFDPKRRVVVLIGGDKTNDKRFYDRMIRKADAIYGAYLERLNEE